MQVRTPITIITGSLGSGKTTLLKHILESVPRKIAILMNEFGEIAIDSKIIKGKHIEMTELDGGCVCCSLIGEFEAAINEIIETIDPELIVVETTGVAEPDAIIVDIEESLPQVRVDGVVTVIDADLMVRFPQIGHTTRIQIEDADLLILNKVDLVKDLKAIEESLREYNSQAPIIHAHYCKIDPELLFGIARKQHLKPEPRDHQHEYTSCSYTSDKTLDRKSFEQFINQLQLIRAKGFVNFSEGTFLFNYVAGRWELEPYEEEATALVFIGKKIDQHAILSNIQSCEV